MFHILMICILWLYLIYVHTHIVLDGMEKSPPKQVAVNFIIANDVVIIPLLTRYSIQKHKASIVDDFPNKKKIPLGENMLKYTIKIILPNKRTNFFDK